MAAVPDNEASSLSSTHPSTTASRVGSAELPLGEPLTPAPQQAASASDRIDELQGEADSPASESDGGLGALDTERFYVFVK